MKNPHRRFVFIDFYNLKNIKFKKLEKVCDRVFVFINSTQENVPFSLVSQMQKMGKGVKWLPIEVPEEDDSMNYHICFLMGKLHQRIEKDVEFAIISNDVAFDPLINFINSAERSCIRVKRKRNHEDDEHHLSILTKEVVAEPATSGGSRFTIVGQEEAITNDIIHKTAAETRRRLVNLKKRPAEVDSLREYILLHNQELSVYGNNIDKIVHLLQENNDIKVEDSRVLYNF
ncbi:MAG: hypothetical protein GY705_15005 [Bacteroidetes bacterium]|nr:hypothetical protein [Bacteroidota bacterium]